MELYKLNIWETDEKFKNVTTKYSTGNNSLVKTQKLYSLALKFIARDHFYIAIVHFPNKTCTI